MTSDLHHWKQRAADGQFPDRRDPNRLDRRAVPRGGRRAGDLPHPLTCPNCGKIHDVKGLPGSRVIRWCLCSACGEVWPFEVNL